MKVRVTFDINDDQRQAINLATNGSLAPAPRETLEGYLLGTVDTQLTKLEDAYVEARAELLAKIKV